MAARGPRYSRRQHDWPTPAPKCDALLRNNNDALMRTPYVRCAQPTRRGGPLTRRQRRARTPLPDLARTRISSNRTVDATRKARRGLLWLLRQRLPRQGAREFLRMRARRPADARAAQPLRAPLSRPRPRPPRRRPLGSGNRRRRATVTSLGRRSREVTETRARTASTSRGTLSTSSLRKCGTSGSWRRCAIGTTARAPGSRRA